MTDFNASEALGACPNCGGTFAPVQVGPYSVDRCSACGGLWLDEGELERVVELDHRALKRGRPDRPPPGTPPGQRERCPRCGGTLIQLTNLRANIKTDSCTVCYGVFLDAGELDAFDQPNLAGSIGHLLRKLIGRP